MKRFLVATLAGMMTLSVASAQTYLDLKSRLDVDAVLETGGAGTGGALDQNGRRIDAASLPASYQEGTAMTTPDGRARFLFAPFKQAGLDAMAVNGQVISPTAGNYESLDLALLSAPGAFADPFTQLELRYADGTKETPRWGPIAGWFNSPTAFDNSLYRYTDSSGVSTVVSFPTDWSDTEAPYLLEQRGNGNSGGNRFVDGTGYALYLIDNLQNVKQAKLGITVGNNFVISVAAQYYDPSVSTTDGYTVLANSMVLYDGFEHRALGNLKEYDFDISSYLAQGTGQLYVLFTDATPSNGWGPFIQRISIFTGTATTFEQRLQPVLDASKATVYGMFQTGTDAEKPFLYDNSGSGPSNRGHRFADGTGSITYRFALPASVNDARLTVDMANNFVVSLSGPSGIVRYAGMTVGTADEKTYLVDEDSSIPGGDYRFADGNSYMIYQFDLPDDATSAYAQILIGNEFVIEAAAGTNGTFQVEKDWVAETRQETHDISNLNTYTIDLGKYLANNPSKIVRLRFSDGVPTDGWGPYLKSIFIVNKAQAGTSTFTPVLNSQDMFGEDIHDEHNKNYYTVSLASVLTNNPTKEVFVKFTDGSTGDGWGPGIFAMMVYSGQVDIQSDGLVFPNLKSTSGDPANYGLALLHRRYAVNAAKTLSAIAFPVQPTIENNKAYLLAATLNAATAPASLKVSRGTGNLLRLSWSATLTGYRLQSAPSLGGTMSWTDVAGTPPLANGEFVFDITATNAASFYRLAK